MVTVRGSQKSVEARLKAGLLACWCGGRLRPWGHARPRRVAMLAGSAELRPRRGVCRGCGRSHVLLPAWLLSRRRYAAPVIFAALALRAAGLKVVSVAARLRLRSPGRAGDSWSVPVSTASSWLSRFAGRAGQLRQAASPKHQVTGLGRQQRLSGLPVSARPQVCPVQPDKCQWVCRARSLLKGLRYAAPTRRARRRPGRAWPSSTPRQAGSWTRPSA